MIVIRKVLLFIILTVLLSCNTIFIKSHESTDNIKDFETVWNAINSVYPLLEYKNLDPDSLYSVYRPLAEQAKGDEIQKLIFDLLRELKDAHIQCISTGGGLIMPYVPPRMIKDKDAFDPLVVRKYFDTELKLACNNKAEYEIFNDNIGYIHISGFEGPGLMDDFHIVMNYIRYTKGLIIDVRRNTGGWRENYSKVIRRFIDVPLDFPGIFTKGEVPYYEAPFLPDSTHFRYSNSVVVLINGTSLSAGETFSEFMNQLPDVTVVGDTTAGGGVVDLYDENIQGEYQLSCGLKIVIGTTYITRYDGVPIEWNGIAPEIFVPQTKEDIENNRDKQLEYAVDYLNSLK